MCIRLKNEFIIIRYTKIALRRVNIPGSSIKVISFTMPRNHLENRTRSHCASTIRRKKVEKPILSLKSYTRKKSNHVKICDFLLSKYRFPDLYGAIVNALLIKSEHEHVKRYIQLTLCMKSVFYFLSYKSGRAWQIRSFCTHIGNFG